MASSPDHKSIGWNGFLESISNDEVALRKVEMELKVELDHSSEDDRVRLLERLGEVQSKLRLMGKTVLRWCTKEQWEEIVEESKNICMSDEDIAKFNPRD